MGIIENLAQILNARYGRDVRQAIHDSIEEGYNIAVRAEGAATSAQDSAAASANAAAGSSAAALQSAQDAAASAAQAMSGTPEGYAALVDKVYSIYKQTASSFALLGTAEGSALARKIYGMSTQNGTPTPSSPVEIKSAKADFRCIGKNLIPHPYQDTLVYPSGKTSNGITFVENEDGSISVSGTASDNASYYLTRTNNSQSINNACFLKKGVAYKLRKLGSNNGGIDLQAYQFVSPYATRMLASGNNVVSAAYTPTQDEEICIRISVPKNTAITGTAIVFPMVTLSEAMDDNFSLYENTPIFTDITLRAIEVTSSDAYNLVKDGKYYIADTLEWSEEKGYQIRRNIGHTIFSSGASYAADGSLVINAPNENPLLAQRTNLLCNFAKSGSGNTDVCRFSSNGQTFLLYSAFKTNISDWNTYLSSNNLIVVYILATPTVETITSEQALSLLSLKTYDVATSIDATGDVSPIVDLEFSKDENTALALSGHNEGYQAQELNNLYGVKNLLPYPYFNDSMVANGLTFTVQSDGTVKVNGTASADTVFAFLSNSVNLPLKEGSLYIATGCPKGGSESTYFIQWANGAWTYGKKDYGDGVLVPIMNESTEYINYVRVIVKNGTACTNLIFKPMLRLASIQSDTFQPYAMSNYELTKKVQELQAAIDAM